MVFITVLFLRVPLPFFALSYLTSFARHDSYGPSTVAKGGGKAFDIEVDIKDPYAFDLLESVNEITRSQREIVEVISAVRSSIFLLSIY